MMNSKEALARIYDYHSEPVFDSDGTTFENMFEKECYAIQKDLDRLEQLEKENKELKNELKRCQDTIKKWTDNHSKLIIDNGKMKRIIKENFSVYDDEVILVGYYPILEEEIKEVLEDE